MPEKTGFRGKATIRVLFHSRIEYEKFRKYIMRIPWSYEFEYPAYEEVVMTFQTVDDISRIDRQIVSLLESGYDVYCCRFALDSDAEKPANETTPDIEGVITTY